MREFGIACLVIGLALCMFGLGGLSARATAQTQAPAIVLPDPDRPGETVRVQEVVVGGLRCAVLLSGLERRAAISCVQR